MSLKLLEASRGILYIYDLLPIRNLVIYVQWIVNARKNAGAAENPTCQQNSRITLKFTMVWRTRGEESDNHNINTSIYSYKYDKLVQSRGQPEQNPSFWGNHI